MEENQPEKASYGYDGWSMLRHELEELDKEYIELDGLKLRPSQCFRIANSSLHVIYNTNCPDSLKEKIETILAKYTDQNENYPLEQEFFFP